MKFLFSFTLVLVFLASATAAEGRRPYEDLVPLLKKLVEVSSDSADPNGNNANQKIVQTELNKLGLNTKLVPQPQKDVRSGDLLIGELKGANSKFVTLLMHTDTVFPKSTGFLKFVRNGDIAVGPGVIDNKGGIVVALHALKVFLAEVNQKPSFSIRVVVSPSEEIGSTGFLDIFTELAKDSVVILGFEPALENHSIVTSRRGDRWYNVTVEGVEAHAGRNHKKGANACHEMAIKIEKLQKLTDYSKDISISIGRMEGGKDKHAIVCGWASAKLDVRFSDLKNREKILEKVEKILNTTFVMSHEGSSPTKTFYTVVDDPKPFPLEPKGQPLIEAYTKAASSLENRSVGHERSGGSADSNFFYRPGLIIIDGLGPTGGNMHRPDEFIDLPSIQTRALATVELLKKALEMF